MLYNENDGCYLIVQTIYFKLDIISFPQSFPNVRWPNYDSKNYCGETLARIHVSENDIWGRKRHNSSFSLYWKLPSMKLKLVCMNVRRKIFCLLIMSLCKLSFSCSQKKNYYCSYFIFPVQNDMVRLTGALLQKRNDEKYFCEWFYRHNNGKKRAELCRD